MKFCLNSRCSREYLKKADEIRIQYRDRGMVDRMIEEYPGKTLVLEYPFEPEEEIPWGKIKKWNILSKNHILLALSRPEDTTVANEMNIPWFMNYQVSSFAELNSLLNAGAAYIRLGEPLFFKMDKIKETGAKVRLTPNEAYMGFPRDNGICGQWIRPEDLHMYEQYGEVCDFVGILPKAEEALYRIYCEQHVWPGELGLIINNLNSTALNRMIHEDTTKSRLNCGQRCMENGSCRVCNRALELARPELFKDIVKHSDNN